jgi:hypothetical protein
VDGEQVADITGANVHRVDCCGIDREPWCYLKLGSYHSPDYTDVRELYIDEVRIGDANSSYQDVAPGATTSVVVTPLSKDTGPADAATGRLFALDGSPLGIGRATSAGIFIREYRGDRGEKIVLQNPGASVHGDCRKEVLR